MGDYQIGAHLQNFAYWMIETFLKQTHPQHIRQTDEQE
jgi:hypothetical protein